jgi:hypothetical protein
MTADEQVIQGILQQIETSWNRYDSISLAAAFAEDANFIQVFGGQLDGRVAIEAAHRRIFRNKGCERVSISRASLPSLSSGRHLGDLGILERDDLPLVLFLLRAGRSFPTKLQAAARLDSL